MSAADEIRREYETRHRRGHHNWQPGPLVDARPSYGPDSPAVPISVLLVCACGVIRRVRLPSIRGSAAPREVEPEPIDWDVLQAQCEHDWLDPDSAPDNKGGRYCMKCAKTEPPASAVEAMVSG